MARTKNTGKCRVFLFPSASTDLLLLLLHPTGKYLNLKLFSFNRISETFTIAHNYLDKSTKYSWYIDDYTNLIRFTKNDFILINKKFCKYFKIENDKLINVKQFGLHNLVFKNHELLDGKWNDFSSFIGNGNKILFVTRSYTYVSS